MKSAIPAAIAATFLCCAAATVAQADIISLASNTLEDLLGEYPSGGIGDVLLTDMSNGKLHAEVRSQSCLNEWGRYVYLYQVNNLGTGTDSSIQMFTLDPFLGIGEEPLAGWLESVPDGFLPESQLPEDEADIDENNVLSFYFTARLGYAIDPGEHSAVLFVVSDNPPELITGNLIGARVGSGEVVGPEVPEPSTLVLIGMGLAALILSRRWKV